MLVRLIQAFAPLRFLLTAASAALVLSLTLCCSVPAHASPRSSHAASSEITVRIDPTSSGPWRSAPLSIGGALDGLDAGAVRKTYTPENARAMRSAGLGAVTYRLRTELGIEAWHWNPEGSWSDAANRRGYWTSAAASDKPISLSFGYRLPRRGSTSDQANNDSYSRIDDGDPATFWKSNPYLDAHFAGDRHPQWVFIDLGSRKPVNAVRIRWGKPFATAYRVEYWQPAPGSDWGGIDETIYDEGRWVPFPSGGVTRGQGGDAVLRLASRPVNCRCLRLWMTASSGDGAQVKAGEDIRDRIGYAIRELSAGVVDRQGKLRDWIRHGESADRQTSILASSTDPWHTAADRDAGIEQPGFDRVFASGLPRSLPMLLPVGIVYDMPENAASEVRWLKSRHIPIRGIELGEEPDGQYVTPEDYASLYLQFAKAIHAVAPEIPLGGPSYQTVTDDNRAWADGRGDGSFTRRFIRYLQGEKGLGDLGFFSFECYPFDDVCHAPWPSLARLPGILARARARWIGEGVPANIPWYITELGYSPYAGEPEVSLSGAMADAEIVAQFLAIGGTAAYFYGYEPNTLIHERPECPTWGNLSLWYADDDGHIVQPFAAYYAMRLLTGPWSGGGRFRVHPAACRNTAGRLATGVTAYAAERGDGAWAVLILNKDPRARHRIRIVCPAHGGPRRARCFLLSPRQYRWRPAGEHGRADPCSPPEESPMASLQAPVVIPAASMAVVSE